MQPFSIANQSFHTSIYCQIMRNHIIFDLDGTLADTAPDLIATLNHVIVPRGLKPALTNNVAKVVGHGAKSMIALAYELNETDLDQATHDALFDEFLDHYKDNLANETRLFEHVVEAMDTLQEGGFDFSICTNKRIEMATPLLKRLNVSERFKAVTGGNSFTFKKPDGRHLQETVQQAGKQLSDAIMIGDSSTDINAAKDAGIPSVAVTFGYSDKPVRELGANEIIETFKMLPEAIGKLRNL